MHRSIQAARAAYFSLSLVLASLVCLALTACAGANPTADERGPAKCPAHVGQSETELLRCGCYWPEFSPTPGVSLISEAQTASGVTRVYRCQVKGAYGHAVTVVNGTVTELVGPTR